VRRSLLLAAGLALAGLAAGCSDAPEVTLIPTNRVVLAELFTWQRCSYCPYAAHALESLATEFDDSLVVIAYHRRMAGDTLSPAYVENRCEHYYTSGGEPATVFDGGSPVRTSGPEQNLEVFRNQILAARSVTPKVQLAVQATFDSMSGTVTTTVAGVDSTPGETLRFFVVVVEDSVSASLVGATDSLFDNVMRAMLPSHEGRPVLVGPRDSVVVTEGFTALPHWRPNKLGLVVFVQQPSTGRVLQAARIARLTQRRR
jgi:thiol-disulfide isomerase/thioredoxin